MGTFVRLQSRSLDPHDLLDSSTWKSYSWGDVDQDCRYGVSTTIDMDDLIRYFTDAECEYTQAYIDQLVVITLIADRATEEDHDSNRGAELVWPTAIVSIQDVPEELATVIRHSGEIDDWYTN